MKTEKIMKRDLMGLEVLQRTSDGYFNASHLLRDWNNNNPTEKRDMYTYKRKHSTNVLIAEIVEMIKSDEAIPQKCGLADYQAIKIVSSKQTKNGKTPEQAWMHPYLFIDFAMWINPKFRLQVLKFVYDQLIQNRHEAGDYYKDMCVAIISLPDANSNSIRKVAVALNHIVFGVHREELRQTATEKQLSDLRDMQMMVHKVIQTGMIASVDKLMDFLRQEWRRRHNIPF